MIKEEVDSKKVLEEFYRNLFSIKLTDEIEARRWVSKIRKKISKESSEVISKEIGVSKMVEVASKMKKGKLPGSDGLGAKVYVKMQFLCGWLKEAWEEAVRDGKMWGLARLVLIRAIHKGGEINLIKNYRLISLCNVDYKIVAKVLANRVEGDQECD
jgi:hypothetical protein